MPKQSSIERYERRDREFARKFQVASLSRNGAGDIVATKEVPEREAHTPLPGHLLKGRSSLIDAEGKVIQRWEIERLEAKQQEEAWRAVADELSRDIKRIEPVALPAHGFTDLLAAYPVGDHHLGMYAWDKEAGDNYDLVIGEKLLGQAGRALIEKVEPCEQALVVLLGDFLHYDSFIPETPAHHNKLDSDSRAQKMIRVATRASIRLILEALARHKAVQVIVESGNHDPYSTGWLRELLWQKFEDEPRVTIDTSPAECHYFEFGANLIGTNHGDKIKMEQLPLVMAADKPDAWGRTQFRYWWTGHVHHSQKQMAVLNKDFKNVSVESFRILPPADAWAAGQGYRSIRDMKALTLHRKWGEVGRAQVNPYMWRDA